MLPCIAIEDRPTTAATRAISWAYRGSSQVLCDLTKLQEVVQLASRVHINRLYLYLDPLDVPSETTGNPNIQQGQRKKGTYSSSTIHDVRVLDQLCRRLHIELVPTFVLTSLHHR